MTAMSWACLWWFLVFFIFLPPSVSFSLNSNAFAVTNGIGVQQGLPLSASERRKVSVHLAQSTERHSHTARPQGVSAHGESLLSSTNVSGGLAVQTEEATTSAATAKAANDSQSSCSGASSTRRFGAAPLAAAVTAEAEGAAAVAVAAATAAAGGRNVALLAAPRGFCEGVSRAVGAVEEALRVFGRPVYVKHQIVHNEFVCKQLEERGAIFVEEIDQVPPNSVVVFSAHGISPEVREAAKARGLLALDATCPLVQKVHVYVQNKAKEGFQIVIIGHKNHVEVQGVKGEAPDAVQVVESEADVAALSYPPNTKLFYVTQTTLSVLDCMRIEKALKKKYPEIETIPSGSVCYATTNRQAALGALSAHAQLALVVGSDASSNAKRLVEVAKNRGIPAYLVAGPEAVNPKWLKGVQRVVVSASASTPETLTAKVMQRLAELGIEVQREALAVNETKPTWKLPKNLRDAAKLVDARKSEKACG